MYNVHFLQYWLLRWFPPSHSLYLGSVPGLFVWDLWWTEWHWVKLFCEYTAFFLCMWCHQCSMLIHSSVTDAISRSPWLMHLRTQSKGIMLWGKYFHYNVSERRSTLQLSSEQLYTSRLHLPYETCAEWVLNKNKTRNGITEKKTLNSEHSSNYCKITGGPPQGQATTYYRIFVFSQNY